GPAGEMEHEVGGALRRQPPLDEGVEALLDPGSQITGDEVTAGSREEGLHLTVEQVPGLGRGDPQPAPLQEPAPIPEGEEPMVLGGRAAEERGVPPTGQVE